MSKNLPMEIPKLVAPSEIPWAEIRGEALEELVYWLCDAIGAVDLVWRAGSATGTSPDRGRDVEAVFHVEGPGGDFRPERWWLQAKGRSRTVEPQAVKDAVIDAQGAKDLAVLVIATNSRYSNNTRDWVEEFQEANPRPAIKLWDRSQLERMVTKHPSVVLRVAPQALTVQGQLEAANDAFWNRQRWPEPAQLDRFWEERENLKFSSEALVACVVGEASIDGFSRHPWGGELDQEGLAQALIVGLANSSALLIRFQSLGKETRVLADGLMYLVACALIRFPEEVALKFVSDPWDFLEDQASLDGYSRDHMRDVLIKPLLGRLINRFGAACEADCSRVSGDFDERVEPPVQDRWLTLVPSKYKARRDEEHPPGFIFESYEEPCTVGLPLTAEHICPFVAGVDRPWEELIPELQKVLAFRIGEQVKAEGTADSEPDP